MLRVRGLVEGADGDLGAWALRLRGCCECECLWLLLRGPGGLHAVCKYLRAGGRADRGRAAATDMSGHVVAAAEAAARLKHETYESTFEVEAPGTGRLGVAFRDSSELWTVTPRGALHRLGVYPGCLLLRANGRPCGATDESALAALEAAAADGDEVRVLLFARPPPPQVPGECRAPRRSAAGASWAAGAAVRGVRRRPGAARARRAGVDVAGQPGLAKTVSSRPCGTTPRPSRRGTCSAKLRF